MIKLNFAGFNITISRDNKYTGDDGTVEIIKDIINSAVFDSQGHPIDADSSPLQDIAYALDQQDIDYTTSGSLPPFDEGVPDGSVS